ncbi:MAG: LytTR family DNA-binding domain-containing protein [Bacteroidales bacterium]|jgi:DNA-binding LytR/AlgR family response regulator|nr:LytTR family DNA-binding domain-containing protein [Bacteroidales bacterium]
MNCIVIDDDRLSCQIISEYVRKNTSLDLIGVYNDSIEARNALIKRQDVELVLLDIEMPEMDGFEFIGSLESPPHIIVITSDESHAAKAFDFNVTDYIVKPVTFPRFCKAIDKIMNASRKSKNDPGDKEIFIKKGTSLVKLKVRDIIYIEALENYVTLNTADDKFVVHFTMKGIEEYLPHDLFVRVQRSYIVNKATIQAIKETSLDVAVGNTTISIPVGKAFRDSLMNDIDVMSQR